MFVVSFLVEYFLQEFSEEDRGRMFCQEEAQSLFLAELTMKILVLNLFPGSS